MRPKGGGGGGGTAPVPPLIDSTTVKGTRISTVKIAKIGSISEKFAGL